MDSEKSDIQRHKAFILIVDDLPVNLQVLGSLLNLEGYNFTLATSGKHALKVIEKKIPDLILLDIMMPEMDGFEVCRQLKSRDENKRYTCYIYQRDE